MKKETVVALGLAVSLAIPPLREHEKEHRDLDVYPQIEMSLPRADYVVNVAAQTVTSSHWVTRNGSETLAEQLHDHREGRGEFSSSTSMISVSGAAVTRKNFRVISGGNLTGRTPSHELEYVSSEHEAIKRCEQLEREGKYAFYEPTIPDGPWISEG